MDHSDEETWNGFSEALKGNRTVRGISSGPSGQKTYELEDEYGNRVQLSLSPRTSYIIGIDIVGYSRRSLDGQFLLTSWLFSIINAAIHLLRGSRWMTANQPSVLIPTGDGALIIFEQSEEGDLSAAAALIFAIQMWVEDINRRHSKRGVSRAFNASQPYPITPIHVRYVLAKGETVPIKGLNGCDNAVGPGIVTCARILASSKGAHYLVQSEVMDDFDSFGGIDGVKQLGDPWDWKQRLHCALMPEKTVKSAKLHFYNVFGKFSPTSLMIARGGGSDVAEYNLGSHDVTSIIG